LEGVQSSLSYRANRVENMVTEIEEESETNQSKVKAAMASFREIINQKEEDLLREIVENAEADKGSVEQYKRELQAEHQGLIEQVLNFVTISRDKEPKKLLEAKPPFDAYRRRADERLITLKPLSRIKKHVAGLEKLELMKNEIRNFKMDTAPKYDNATLRQRIVNGRNQATLDLSSATLTDQDMELVASELEINKVNDLTKYIH
jgi:hypothetical protein